ncbi:MAG: 50S ribosomal protein L4 [Clostridia bacterium]
MPKATVYDMTGKQVGEMELDESIFGVTPNDTAMHEAVKNHLANCRQGTQSTLTRAEVRGGGIKPWRQKGTGRARQGSIRSPQWTHGGIAFGPKPRSYSYRLNKKFRRIALKSALSVKASEGEIIIIDNLDLAGIKTRDFTNFLKAIEVSGKALVVTPEVRENVVLSARNVPGIKTTTATILNVYDVLNARKFIVDRDAIAKIQEVFA